MTTTTYIDTHSAFRPVNSTASSDLSWSKATDVPDFMNALKNSIREVQEHSERAAPVSPELVARFRDWALNRAPSDGRRVRDDAWR